MYLAGTVQNPTYRIVYMWCVTILTFIYIKIKIGINRMIHRNSPNLHLLHEYHICIIKKRRTKNLREGANSLIEEKCNRLIIIISKMFFWS